MSIDSLMWTNFIKSDKEKFLFLSVSFNLDYIFKGNKREDNSAMTNNTVPAFMIK